MGDKTNIFQNAKSVVGQHTVADSYVTTKQTGYQNFAEETRFIGFMTAFGFG